MKNVWLGYVTFFTSRYINFPQYRTSNKHLKVKIWLWLQSYLVLPFVYQRTTWTLILWTRAREIYQGSLKWFQTSNEIIAL